MLKKLLLRLIRGVRCAKYLGKDFFRQKNSVYKILFTLIIGLIFLLIPYVLALSPLSLTKPIPDGFGVNIGFTHPKAGEMGMIAEAYCDQVFKW
jgi:hypothetical protein